MRKKNQNENIICNSPSTDEKNFINKNGYKSNHPTYKSKKSN